MKKLFSADDDYLFAVGVAAEKLAGQKENSDIGNGQKALFTDAK